MHRVVCGERAVGTDDLRRESERGHEGAVVDAGGEVRLQRRDRRQHDVTAAQRHRGVKCVARRRVCPDVDAPRSVGRRAAAVGKVGRVRVGEE